MRSAPPPQPGIIVLSLWLYWLLLRIGPASYHDEYAAATLQVFRQCCRDAYRQRGAPGVLALWLPMFSETIAGLLAERFGEEKPRRVLRFRLWWPVLVAAILVLFPFGWLVQVWPSYRQLFDVVFATPQAHEIGHVTVFLIAGVFVLCSLPALRARLLLYLLLLALGAVGEEALQGFVRLQLPRLDGRDLLLDLLGFVSAYACVKLLQWSRTAGKAHPGPL